MLIHNLKKIVMFLDKNNGYNMKMFSILIIFNSLYLKSEQYEKHPNLIYILQWTESRREPFVYWKPGRKYFKAMNCEYQNCFITNNISYFDEVTDYDVILFNAIDITGDMDLPLKRSDNQIYAFITTDSAVNYPTNKDMNWFFNYTITYKLDSDIPYPYIIVRNKLGEVIAPKKEVHWMDVKKMNATSQSIIDRLQTKKIAAAWFATNCDASNERLTYVHNLREALTSYNLEIDIYGGCGYLWCARENPDNCLSKVETDYYFYLSFENSYSVDYVTEKLLTALNHYAVPIVLAGGNYTRFAPKGIYLDGGALGEEEVARKMNEAIQNKQIYYEYFKWHGYYTFHDATESPETDPLCAFCAFLNNKTVRTQRRVYARFFEWWNEVEHTSNDPIFYYEPVLFPEVNIYFIKMPHKDQVLPSILQNIQQFVGDVYNHFFEPY